MQKKLLLAVAAVVLVFHSVSLCAQGDNLGPGPSLFEFFYHHEDTLPVLKMETDWKKLIRKKLDEAHQPAVLSFQGADGSTARLNISVRARGNARKEVCFLPPLKVKATQSGSQQLGLHPIQKLKLVLPCEDGGVAEQSLLREALAYQLYEVVYPLHHRTRVIRLEGWHKEKQEYAFYAFLVEDDKEFAARVGGTRIKEERIRTIDLERDAYVKMCFFQYMIGNTDWSEPNSHNLLVLKLPSHEKPVPIPYDFDYSGFVDTDYAIPRSSLPIKDVEERFFLGKYVTEDEALACARYYLSKKEQVLQKCRAFTWIEAATAQSIHTFISGFFSILEDEEQVLEAFVTRPTRQK